MAAGRVQKEGHYEQAVSHKKAGNVDRLQERKCFCAAVLHMQPMRKIFIRLQF